MKSEMGMGWEMMRLGDVLDYEQPTDYIVSSDLYDDDFTTPVLTAGKSFILGYTNETHGVYSNLPVIIFDDFTTATKFVDFQFKVKSSAMKILKAKEGIADTRYMFYLLQTLNLDSEQHKRYWISKFAPLQIPLPPLATQKRIAEILDAADALKRKDQELLKKYDELAQAIFIDMFGDPVKNEKDWEKGKAESYIDLLTGYAFKSEKYSNNDNDTRLCGGLIIMPWGIEWKKSNKWKIESSSTLEKYFLEIDDIVMALDRPWISSGFKIAMIKDEDIPSLLVQRTARIRAKGINQHFLYFLFKHPEFERFTIPTETTVPHISPLDIKKYELIIPPIELQNRYSKNIQSIEKQKQIFKTNLESSNSLFNSLIQKAFRGELV